MKRKIFPRISTQLTAVVTNQDGDSLKITALDTTQYGFSFQCSTLQRNSLTPGGSFIYNGRPMALHVLLDLPFPDESLQIQSRCHVAFSRRIANDKCEIGIRYGEFEGDGYAYLIKFLETMAKSASIAVMPGQPSISPVQLFL